MNRIKETRNIDDSSRWIICPVCAKKLHRTRMISGDCTCDCGQDLTIVASKKFVTVILHEPGDEMVSLQERISQYQQEFLTIAD